MSQKGFSYHWLIVIACFCLTAVSIGITVNCFGPLSVALSAKFPNATSSAIQYVFMIAAIMNLVGSAVVGKIMEKFTMRIAMPVYAIILSGGVLMWSQCTTLQMYYIVAGFVGFGASGIAIIPCGALINNWFEEKKGLATGLAFTGSGAGGLLLVQMAQNVLGSSNDLQSAYLALGIVAAVISIPISIFVVREHPRDKGLAPYGSTGKGSTDQLSLPGIPLKQYIKTGSFWLLGISVFIIAFINVGLQNHISIYLTKKGINADMAANIFSLYLLLLILGKILLGSIYDKVGIAIGSIYGLITYIATVGLLFYTGHLYLAIAAAVFFSLAGSMTTVTPPYVTARIVGLKDFAKIFGILNLFYGIGLVLGPVIAAKIYDASCAINPETSLIDPATGSYTNVFVAFGALAFVLCLATILSARKREEYSQMA